MNTLLFFFKIKTDAIKYFAFGETQTVVGDQRGANSYTYATWSQQLHLRNVELTATPTQRGANSYTYFDLFISLR